MANLFKYDDFIQLLCETIMESDLRHQFHKSVDKDELWDGMIEPSDFIAKSTDNQYYAKTPYKLIRLTAFKMLTFGGFKVYVQAREDRTTGVQTADYAMIKYVLPNTYGWQPLYKNSIDRSLYFVDFTPDLTEQKLKRALIKKIVSFEEGVAKWFASQTFIGSHQPDMELSAMGSLVRGIGAARMLAAHCHQYPYTNSQDKYKAVNELLKEASKIMLELQKNPNFDSVITEG
jgi:hypothetical protein